MKRKTDYSLYLVTDSELTYHASLEQAVEQAIKGGCTIVQLREKKATSSEFYHKAQKVKLITDFYNIPLIINDRVDIALAIDAAGVHIGQKDLPARVIRTLIGDHKIMGVSASTLCEAVSAHKDGADYLGVGAMFATQTKTDARHVSMKDLKDIKETVSLPVIAIGGINKETIPLLANTGIDGIAVVSAVISEKDITNAAKELKGLFEKYI